MTSTPAGAQSPSAPSRGVRWSWRWLLLELVALVLLLGLSLAPGVRTSPVQWTVLGVGIVVAGVGLIVGFGFFFYSAPVRLILGFPSDRSRRSPDVVWSRLSRARRRDLGRMLRRGQADQIRAEHREAARWYAASSLRSGLPQATGQAGLGVSWAAMTVLDTPGSGQWWFHLALGVLFGSLGLVVVWLLPELRRSLAELEAHESVAAGDTDGTSRPSEVGNGHL